MFSNDKIFNKIAEALLVDYSSVYYVNALTNEYQWYSVDPEFHSLHIEHGGEDFFKNIVRDADKVVYEEDKPIFMDGFKKEKLLADIKKGTMQSIEYRLMIDGKPVYHTLRLIRGIEDDEDYFILGVINIDERVRDRERLRQAEHERAIYTRISESLAAYYDVLLYIDSDSGNFSEFSFDKKTGTICVTNEGNNFFSSLTVMINNNFYRFDKKNVLRALTKEKLIEELSDKKQYTLEYRIVSNGEPIHTRLTAMWSSDRSHFIIGIENIEEQLKKEREHLKALKIANEMARRDELTGIKNKNAFYELEKTVQSNLDNGLDYLPFAIVVCDINNLKLINDTLGHKAGDEYIKSSCKLVCNIFAHSPVFRVGGDEFVVFLRSSDYENRSTLIEDLHNQVVENMKKKEGPIVASGMAVYDPRNDKLFTDVFERADTMMYENKKWLKKGALEKHMHGPDSLDAPLPLERKKKLDALFEAFSVVADGTYVYICDMKYDYSRWSKSAVKCFGLPSEYMLGAGGIWEKHIHPEDAEVYHSGISAVFSGNALGHDMQYRARKLNGDYVLCTCRGVVIRDPNEIPEFFCGSIRNHGIHGHIDPLTGLRNQYGFFEDIEANMVKNTEMRICMIGIGKFSEINEVYGYHFGNIVLQKFGRYMFENIRSSESIYRLDGTKFAVISTSLTVAEMKERYEKLRTHFRKGFFVDDKFIILDLNSGILTVDNFMIDVQTVYACLNFAYGESKVRRQGDLVEFYNDLNDENKHRIEKLHVIRASIMQDYQGFYLLYQPVVDAVSEKIIGAEALLRWRNDEYGIVPPDHFIPILEKDPLFFKLGQWILKTAILGAKELMKKYPDFIINVNLSYTQLEKTNFLDMVFDTLEDTDFPPEHLCLEITERCRLLNIDMLKNIIVNLRGRGIRIALDDFGTGFSSMEIVKELPFDVIKIDRSFVMKIEEDMKERTFIKTFAEVSSTYGAKVCVEGIETAGMRHILLNYHVHSLQGYYYSRPVELDKLLQLDTEKNQ
ncbi:MAG: EAL domain-containing protein [Ruminococcus sp.]|nr:EAL domain-containing protein [Ruminococcus sp.]MCR4793794.1 EAL domain-containing protein [Ruminococcus sp.]